MSSEIKNSSIPTSWNLTEDQQTNMKTAQQKVIDQNNKNRIKEQNELNSFQSHASLSPPEYPILVVIKDNNLSSSEKQVLKDNKNAKYYYFKQYYLQSNNDYIYSTSFDDAVSKVKNNLVSNSANKLRISSDNIKGPPQTKTFDSIPNNPYKYWEINVTNAPASMFSSFKKTIRKLGGKKRRSNKKSKKRSNKKLKKRSNKKSNKRYY